jgi:tRNA nucleotidyltransferase (CCA-adding enzyme)
VPQATRISVFNGVKFATVVVNTDSFLTGMSSIAEELLELTACDVALLGVMHRGGGGGRAHYLSVIGRVAPRAVTVDLNAALQPYGGGGHAKAAAASVRMSDDESTDGGVPDPAADAAASAAARARASALLEVVATTLRAQIPAEVRADSIMTTDVVTLTPDQTVDDARAKLLEHQLRGAPVIDAESGKLLGLLKLSDLVKAAQGGRGGGKIKGVVRTNVPTVSPGMPFVELEEFIMERGIGRLPVIEDSGKLVGIITRTDILRHHNLYPSLKPRTFPDEAE